MTARTRTADSVRALGVGVVGYGYWGPNMVRNFHAAPGSRVVGICDLDPEKLAKARATWPGVKLVQDYDHLVRNADVQAVCLATPVASHFDLALRAIEAGKHVLVAKPMTASVREAEALRDAAARRNVVLMVDHTFVYTGAVRRIRELVDAGQLGELYYYDGVRVNLGLFQHDVNVLWDLAIHDLSILDFIIQESPEAVSATGVSHIPDQPENVAYLTLFFRSNLIAHLHANWLAPVKVRRTLLGGSKKMLIYDELEPSEKIRLYDRGVDFADSDEDIKQMLISYRSGDAWMPKIDLREALATEVEHFLECITNGREPLTGAEAGIRTVRILEAANRSMQQFGAPVRIEPA